MSNDQVGCNINTGLGVSALWAHPCLREAARYRLLQQGFGFLFELGFQLIDVIPAQGFMFAGIGFDFGAVQAHCAQLKQPHGFCKHQYLDKQAFNLFAKAFAKAVDGVVI